MRDLLFLHIYVYTDVNIKCKEADMRSFKFYFLAWSNLRKRDDHIKSVEVVSIIIRFPLILSTLPWQRTVKMRISHPVSINRVSEDIFPLASVCHDHLIVPILAILLILELHDFQGSLKKKNTNKKKTPNKLWCFLNLWLHLLPTSRFV